MLFQNHRLLDHHVRPVSFSVIWRSVEWRQRAITSFLVCQCPHRRGHLPPFSNWKVDSSWKSIIFVPGFKNLPERLFQAWEAISWSSRGSWHTATSSTTLGYNNIIIIKIRMIYEIVAPPPPWDNNVVTIMKNEERHLPDYLIISWLMIIDDHPKHKDHLVVDQTMIIDDHQKHKTYLMVDQPSTVARHAG